MLVWFHCEDSTRSGAAADSLPHCCRRSASADGTRCFPEHVQKQNKDKAVATAARSVILLFRELAPGLLAKKDRGKGHEKGRALPEFGAAVVKDRIDGAELLEQAIARGSDGEGSDDDEDGDGESGGGGGSDSDFEGMSGSDGEARARGLLPCFAIECAGELCWFDRLC